MIYANFFITLAVCSYTSLTCNSVSWLRQIFILLVLSEPKCALRHPFVEDKSRSRSRMLQREMWQQQLVLQGWPHPRSQPSPSPLPHTGAETLHRGSSSQTFFNSLPKRVRIASPSPLGSEAHPLHSLSPFSPLPMGKRSSTAASDGLCKARLSLGQRQ